MIEKEGTSRGQWEGRFEFLLSCIGVCVGLGNVWRFPYLTYQNGGGAFLIPYFIMLLLCGVPLFKLELCFGQFAGQGPITAWRAVPICKGIGIGMVVLSFLVGIYYNVIIGWSLFYLFASMQSVLPWTLCDQWWNKESYCPPNSTSFNATNSDSAVRVQYRSSDLYNESNPSSSNISLSPPASNITYNRRASTSEDYWRYRVLRVDRSTGMEDPGVVLWDLSLCLLLAWVMVFFCLFKGIKSSGKVVYFTAIFPYFLLIILFIRGVTLEGAGDGVIFYVTPIWSKLRESAVWIEAATQIFYSLGLSFGALLTLASYNNFHNNILSYFVPCLLYSKIKSSLYSRYYVEACNQWQGPSPRLSAWVTRDALIVSIGNCATSVFSGFVIFSIIGHMAHELNLKVEDVIDQGPGLAFVAYPQAVALLPGPQFWAVMFFFMLLNLGIDSEFTIVETVATGIVDEFPSFFKEKKLWVTLFVCIASYLMGLIMVTEGGIYWFHLFDYYSASYGLLFLSLTFTVALNWGYGFFFTYPWRLMKDVKLMLGREPHCYYKATWMVISPLTIICVMLFSLATPHEFTYGNYIYPTWANTLGFCLGATSILPMFLYAIVRFIHAWQNREPLKALIQPSNEWRPSDKTIPYHSQEGQVTYNNFGNLGGQNMTPSPQTTNATSIPDQNINKNVDANNHNK